jgi:hypothetical protein
MGQYFLHTGKHVSWSPDKKNPDHVYVPGDVVSDDKIDLAASYPEKFSYLGQRPGAGNIPETPETLEAQIKDLAARRDALKKEAAAQAGGKPNPVGAPKAIDQMTDAELKTFCEDEEIDVSKFKPTKPADAAQTLAEKRAFVKSKVGG